MKAPAAILTSPDTKDPPVPEAILVTVSVSVKEDSIVISSFDLDKVTFAPAIKVMSSVIPAPALPPEVNRIIYSAALAPSTAAIE